MLFRTIIVKKSRHYEVNKIELYKEIMKRNAFGGASE